MTYVCCSICIVMVDDIHHFIYILKHFKLMPLETQQEARSDDLGARQARAGITRTQGNGRHKAHVTCRLLCVPSAEMTTLINNT